MCYSLTVAISDSIDSSVRLVKYTYSSFEDITLTLYELDLQYYIHAFSCIRVPISVDVKEVFPCHVENI